MNNIIGKKIFDDRGSVSFVNDFNFSNVKRFYHVKNHLKGFIRAWHAHKKEEKYVYVSSGVIKICAVKIDDFKNPYQYLDVEEFYLSSETPSILHIPGGYANGFMTLSDNADVIFYSSSTLEESKNDDYRYSWCYWNPWNTEYR